MFLHQQQDADSTHGASSRGECPVDAADRAGGGAGALRGRRAGLGAVDIHRRDDVDPGPQDIGKHCIAHAHRCVYDDGAK